MSRPIKTTKRPRGQRTVGSARRPGPALPASTAPKVNRPGGGQTGGGTAADPAFRARTLARAEGAGALATVRTPDGAPFASLASVAWDMDGCPLFLLSALADHTRNLTRDSRASLLIVGAPTLNAQARARLTLTGPIVRTDDARLLARYLARHPEAGPWAGFADFALFRMAPSECRLILGFAGARRMAGRQFCLSGRDLAPLIAAEADLLRRINDDRAVVARAFARLGSRSGARSERGFRAVGLDPDGIDFVHCTRGTGAVRHLRVPFAAPARDPARWMAAFT